EDELVLAREDALREQAHAPADAARAGAPERRDALRVEPLGEDGADELAVVGQNELPAGDDDLARLAGVAPAEVDGRGTPGGRAREPERNARRRQGFRFGSEGRGPRRGGVEPD